MFQNPTDTRTSPTFIEYLKTNNTLDTTIIDGYGAESNYRFLEDGSDQHTALIPYGTMLKEKSRKWKSDDRAVMN